MKLVSLSQLNIPPVEKTTTPINRQNNAFVIPDMDERVKYLREGAWEGQRCFIVGGGPSLRNFDFSKLKNELTIGINRAFEFFDPTIIFSMDTRFLDWVKRGEVDKDSKDNSEKARIKYENYTKGLKIFLDCAEYFFMPDEIPIKWNGKHDITLGLKNGLAHGENSGFAALHLAILLGANPIYLLGFDMKGNEKTGKQEHFHNGYQCTQENHIYPNFIRHFVNNADIIKDFGVNVINLSLDSALPCFPKASYKDISYSKLEYPFFVSFHTDHKVYNSKAQFLKAGLRTFGLDYKVTKIPHSHNWIRNTHEKPKIILESLLKEKRPVVWVDADARINKRPEILAMLNATDIDLACHLRDGWEHLTGTVYFGYSETTIEFLRKWIDLNEVRPENHDQLNFQAIIKDYKLKFYNLPAEYCCIFDGMPEAGENPVIEHFQASRQIRKEEANG